MGFAGPKVGDSLNFSFFMLDNEADRIPTQCQTLTCWMANGGGGNTYQPMSAILRLNHSQAVPFMSYF